MLLAIEKILFFKSVALFKNISAEQLQFIAEIAKEVEIPENTVIFNEGDEGDVLYLIVSGTVQIVKEINNKKTVLAVLNEQQCFGEMSILDNETRSAGAETLEDSKFLIIDRNSFYNLVRDQHEIAFEIFKVLSGRIREMNKKLMSG